jgi:hypothetical protein
MPTITDPRLPTSRLIVPNPTDFVEAVLGQLFGQGDSGLRDRRFGEDRTHRNRKLSLKDSISRVGFGNSYLVLAQRGAKERNRNSGSRVLKSGCPTGRKTEDRV